MCRVEDGNRDSLTAPQLPIPLLAALVSKQLECSAENVSTNIIFIDLMTRCLLDCNDGDIRLVGGATKYEGTVEICFSNLWGLISETGWGDNDAQVVCRQLQYDSKGMSSHSIFM